MEEFKEQLNYENENKEKQKKERILIVEDDFPNMIGALQAFQGDKNIEDCIAVKSYEEAVSKIDEFKPSAALLDVNIIGGSGKEVAKILKEKGIPYVFVTASGNNQIEIQSDEETLMKLEKNMGKDVETWQVAYELLKKRRESKE